VNSRRTVPISSTNNKHNECLSAGAAAAAFNLRASEHARTHVCDSAVVEVVAAATVGVVVVVVMIVVVGVILHSNQGEETRYSRTYPITATVTTKIEKILKADSDDMAVGISGPLAVLVQLEPPYDGDCRGKQGDGCLNVSRRECSSLRFGLCTEAKMRRCVHVSGTLAVRPCHVSVYATDDSLAVRTVWLIQKAINCVILTEQSCAPDRLWHPNNRLRGLCVHMV